MKLAKNLLSPLIVSAVLAVPVQAATIIVASDNATLSKRNAATDVDESEVISASSDGSGRSALMTSLRFDVSTLTGVTDTTQASLDLYVVLTRDIVSVVALNDGVSGETTWNSGTLWSTRPWDVNNVVPNTDTSSLLTSASIPANGSILSLNLTGILDDLLAADTNGEITFILYGSDQNSEFASVTNTSGFLRPSLNVDVIPEPSVTILCSLGALVLLRRRRH